MAILSDREQARITAREDRERAEKVKRRERERERIKAENAALRPAANSRRRPRARQS